MNKITWNRRIVLAAASVALIGGGVAVPATAMAATAAPQHTATLPPGTAAAITPGPPQASSTATAASPASWVVTSWTPITRRPTKERAGPPTTT